MAPRLLSQPPKNLLLQSLPNLLSQPKNPLKNLPKSPPKNLAKPKALLLLPFLLVVFSVRFVDWNSRKPFLRDLYSIKEGMTPAQVERIMGAYIEGGGRPLDSPANEVDERGEMVTGTVTYRHTDEGWGDSDWGVVTFENGRVVDVEFLPD